MAQNTFKRDNEDHLEDDRRRDDVFDNNHGYSNDNRENYGRFSRRDYFWNDKRVKISFGMLLMLFSLFAFFSCISFIFTGNADQSIIGTVLKTGIRTSGSQIENWFGLFGAIISYFFVFKWFGIAIIVIFPILFSISTTILFNKQLFPVRSSLTFMLFFLFWISTTFGYVVYSSEQEATLSFLCGGIGYEIALIFNHLIGWAAFLLLFVLLCIFIIFFYDIHTLGIDASSPSSRIEPEFIRNLRAKLQNLKDKLERVKRMKDTQSSISDEENENDGIIQSDEQDEIDSDGDGIADIDEEIEEDLEEEIAAVEERSDVLKHDLEEERRIQEELARWTIIDPDKKVEKPKDLSFEVLDTTLSDIDELPVTRFEDTKLPEVDQVELVNSISEKDVDHAYGKLPPYDPKLDLYSYQYPSIDLLNEVAVNKIPVTKEELESNKDKIVETLNHYGITIAKISATIGPTVTLYEIVPEAGIRIAKIKSLEDDIAMSLSALGIRIIAPIPGKGTIGIEVPNKNKEMVAMRAVLSNERFTNTDKELPIALGKTISNEVFVADLATMPHLLIAGSTGQGKSVGLNVLISSLIFKKHPSQLKFVMVDPKMVELSLFNRIEKHFLAKLPNNDEAIITDTKKVINTLNSLVMEMENRYELLKKASCRNLKEYNGKFVERKLLPTEGHYFMPYIVLIIDELADLMMTAGKEVETPIARLAQKARAIGIHLVVATQRPSVNVITGVIKANFPARLSFRVISKIDSRTILDTGGAEQLIGKGDMLLSTGSDLTRIQCAFIDTPEVEKICDFIGDQRGYSTAYYLPDYKTESSESNSSDLSDRDPLFTDAARVIVLHQQGSTSLIQRKLSLGYNRAGRLIDQLEAAGIVGPFEGSKAREVLVKDEQQLEMLLRQKKIIDN